MRPGGFPVRQPAVHILRLATLLVLVLLAPGEQAGARSAGPVVVDPATFAGHRIGEDRKLVKWPRIVEYFELLAARSNRVRLAELGKTTGGNRMIAAVISSPDNLAASDRHRDTAKRLARARGVTEDRARELAAGGKAIVAVTLNLHSTEIASSQMALELGYHLATDDSQSTAQILEQTIVLLVPSLNPDGQIMVCDWYEKGLGTPLEGGRLPWLYHPYAGHDNNRDWFMLNLVETRHVTRFLYQDWFPQAIHDQHQMGGGGARMFVPPYFDPINPNVHPLIWREIASLGGEMCLRLEERKLSGVVSSATYDGWRPGDMDTTPWWHNVPALITETASVAIASPVERKAADLTGELRGLPTYAPQMNFPNPWPGGWWRLRDIVEYELTAALGFLDGCARLKTDLLLNSHRMGRDAIARGETDAPAAFLIPPGGNDAWTVARLLEPLLLAGVEVQKAREAFVADEVPHPAGTYVISLAQSLRPYAKDLLEAQRYPERRLYPGGPPEPPYDEAGWTLPLKMGVRVVPVAKRFDAELEPVTAASSPPGDIANAAVARAVSLPTSSNASTIAVNRLLKAGVEVRWGREAFIVVPSAKSGLEPVRKAVEALGIHAEGVAAAPADAPRLKVPRVGLYQPWGGSADEGWTRWVFEKFEMPFETLHAGDFRKGNLGAGFDAVVLPSMSAHEIRTGEYSARTTKPTLPPPYAGGLGEEGVTNLAAFVRDGGTLVALDAATEFAISQLGLAVRNVLADTKPEQFYCPGSLLEARVDPTNLLTAGFGSTASVFFLRSPAFEILPAFGEAQPRALAVYGDKPLQSGWILGAGLLDKRAAAVDAPAGRGRAILIGFRPQFRGQTYGTFRMLFNAIYYAGLAQAGGGRR